MATVNTYLLFNGDCEAAFNLYQSVFNGDIPFMGRFKDMPPEEGQPPVSDADANRIMHVSMSIGDSYLMGSDCMTDSPGYTFSKGNNFSVSVNTESVEEADRIFNGLSAGGQVTMPMNKTFWGAYFGMLTDKFGIQWMVNYDTQESKHEK